MTQPWIRSARFDLSFILAPPFLAILLGLSLSGSMAGAAIPPWAWVAFILCVDVGHVYSTLFRTYLDPVLLEERRSLFTFVPLGCWLLGIALYSVGAALFWTVLAYLAVFHFARQAYGFLALYSKKEKNGSRRIDQLLVYLATLYPLLYWHAHLPRNFHWFIDGDFVKGLPPIVATLAGYLYLLVIVAYLVKEATNLHRGNAFNLPKQLVLLGTAASWYIGIVALNGDFVFTVTNVVAHGIPYIALVWIVGRMEAERQPARLGAFGLSYARLYSVALVPAFVALLIVLGYLEEGLWDAFIWREHRAVFSVFSGLPKLFDHGTLTWLVPLLALPQSTHYVLDGFIWRLKGERNFLAKDK